MCKNPVSKVMLSGASGLSRFSDAFLQKCFRHVQGEEEKPSGSKHPKDYTSQQELRDVAQGKEILATLLCWLPLWTTVKMWRKVVGWSIYLKKKKITILKIDVPCGCGEVDSWSGLWFCWWFREDRHAAWIQSMPGKLVRFPINTLMDKSVLSKIYS